VRFALRFALTCLLLGSIGASSHVSAQDPDIRNIRPHVVLLVDTSGSMVGNRMTLAKQVARLAMRRLQPHDKVGIVEFYGAKRWAAPIQPAVPARLEESAEMDCVERVLDEMPDQHRSILSMSLYEGYSHSEIADQLDIPLGTVKTRVRRGLMRIREQLEIGDEELGAMTG